MSNTLVAYFSASGTTAKLAKTLASAANADLYEIKPEIPYTDADLNWNNSKSRSSIEMNDKTFRPAISGKVENMNQYDTIYVGFPIWWYVAPTIINTFLEQYDLSGKTVALFCTSGGSGLSGTVNEVKSLEPNATVTQGLHIGSGSSSNPDNAVSEWLNALGLAK